MRNASVSNVRSVMRRVNVEFCLKMCVFSANSLRDAEDRDRGVKTCTMTDSVREGAGVPLRDLSVSLHSGMVFGTKTKLPQHFQVIVKKFQKKIFITQTRGERESSRSQSRLRYMCSRPGRLAGGWGTGV